MLLLLLLLGRRLLLLLRKRRLLHLMRTLGGLLPEVRKQILYPGVCHSRCCVENTRLRKNFQRQTSGDDAN